MSALDAVHHAAAAVSTALATTPGLSTAGSAAAPSPSPSGPARQLDATDVTPGIAGFVATFALVAVCVLLFRSLVGHLRRAGHNARERGMPVQEPRRVGGRAPGGAAAGQAPGAGTDGGAGGGTDPGADDGTDGTDGGAGGPAGGRP